MFRSLPDLSLTSHTHTHTCTQTMHTCMQRHMCACAQTHTHTDKDTDTDINNAYTHIYIHASSSHVSELFTRYVTPISGAQTVTTVQVSVPSPHHPLPSTTVHLALHPRWINFTWWGCYGLCPRHKPTKLAHSFYFVLVSVFSLGLFQLYFIP